jgi:hypothetical protein
MFPVVVREAGEAKLITESQAHLEDNVVARVQDASGFVTALWDDRPERQGVEHSHVFDSEEAGTGALARVRDAARPEGLQLESAVLYEVLARA